MNIIWGTFLTIIASLGWLGQLITAFWPETAVTLSLTEWQLLLCPILTEVRDE